MAATIQIESNRETGNWAYVVRNRKGERVLATGDYLLAKAELNKQSAMLNIGIRM